jgi:hypothetical protein
MRVDVAELEQIRDGLAGTGRRYSEPDLEGAILDCDHALYEGGFRRPGIKGAVEGGVMVVYRSWPLWEGAVQDEIVPRLEDVWARHGAFQHEAHTVTLEGDRVLFDFVTWWDDGKYYTGRIEIEPTPAALDEEPPAIRLKS